MSEDNGHAKTLDRGHPASRPSDPDRDDWRERELMASLLYQSGQWDNLPDELTPDRLTQHPYRLIFAAGKRLHAEGVRPTVSSLADQLHQQGELHDLFIHGRPGLEALLLLSEDGHRAGTAIGYVGRILNRPGQPDPDADNPLIAGSFSSAEFMGMTFTREWFVDDMVAAGEPLVVAGPSKTIKTGLAVNLAAAVASGKPFLGRPVPRARSVTVISAESGPISLRERYADVCRTLKVNPSDLPIRWYTKIELLSTVAGIEHLRGFLRKHPADLGIFDPSYLLLGGDVTTDSPGNMFAMGQLLDAVGKACLETGSTPVFVTHANGRLQTGRPMELGDIAWSGFQQWARQWFLISRQTEYQDDGRHKLYFRYGGSAGHTGLLSLDLDEGIRPDRKWDLKVTSSREARQAEKDAAADECHRKLQADCDVVLKAIVALIAGPTTVATKNALYERLSLTKTEIKAAVGKLLADGAIVEAEGKVRCNAGSRAGFGFQRPTGAGR